MARREMFSKEDILNKSVCFVKEFGIDNLTVRELAKYIGCSTQPIFKYYKSVDEFKTDLYDCLKKHFESFIKKYIDEENYLLSSSYAYVLYSIKETKIFSSLFLSSFIYDTSYDRNRTIISMRMQYNISRDLAEALYRDIKFYIHGIACLLCNGNIKLDENEIYNLIKEMIDVYLNRGLC